MKTNQQKNKGFILIEMIVVLIVLAILAALLIPAMTGWIDTTREKNAIAECRQVVIAAQTIASEAYATETLGSDSMMREPYFSEIRVLSEVKGVINAIVIAQASAQVTRVEYTSLRGIFVVYDISQTPVYSTSAGSPTNAAVITSSVQRLLAQLSTQENWNLLSRDKQTQALQAALLGLYYGAYPELTTEYQAMLSSKGMTDTSDLDWRPILSSDGQVLLAASKEAVTKANPMSVLVYYNGSFYYHAGHNGKGVTTAHISDQKFDLSSLKDTPSDPPASEWIKLS